MKIYVVDASVVTKCFIIEDQSEKAAEVIDAHIKGYLSLLAPSLMIYELGNVFWKHPQISYEKAYKYVRRFLDLQIKLVDIWSHAELLKNVCRMSEIRNVTFYDASYVGLAEENETKLITADDGLHNKAPDVTVLLKEFKI